MAIYDTMQLLRPDVQTPSAGPSMGAVLLARNRGQALRAAQLAHPHPPAVGRRAGRASDIAIRAGILRIRTASTRSLLPKQPVEKLANDADRDFIMDAAQAKEYGIVDQVISRRER